MAPPKLLLSHLRRSRPLLSTLFSYRPPSLPLTTSPISNPNPNASGSHPFPIASFHFLPYHHRTFSTHPSDDALPDHRRPDYSDFFRESPITSPELVNPAVDAVDQVLVNGGVAGGGGEPILPVRALISLLDGYHDLTGLPWWIVIVSSTLAMRLMLLPFLALQLQKMKQIGQLLPKLPPPFPPPLSGRSYADQFSLFLKEKRAIGCPSFYWLIANLTIQMPLFFCWLTSIRRMSLDHHPGFECGGALWFLNLTEFSNGPFGPIFPVSIAVLHYIIVQLSFEKSSLHRMTSIFGISAKHYKTYLELMSLPLLFIGFNIPQGSQVYWVTNSSLTIIQQLAFRHPVVREKLGLPDKDSRASTEVPQAIAQPELASADSPEKFTRVSAKDLSPKQLLQLSVQLISDGNREVAISLLQQAIEKDPDHVEAMIVMGQALLQEGHPIESAKLLEDAISKLLVGNPTNVYLLILAYQWAGVACVQQGKKAEGITHLKRVASYEEPEDLKTKVHYFDSLVMLAAALHDEGHQAEAARYLDLAVAYNPAYKDLFERCAKVETDFVSALVNSRRADY